MVLKGQQLLYCRSSCSSKVYTFFVRPLNGFTTRRNNECNDITIGLALTKRSWGKYNAWKKHKCHIYIQHCLSPFDAWTLIYTRGEPNHGIWQSTNYEFLPNVNLDLKNELYLGGRETCQIGSMITIMSTMVFVHHLLVLMRQTGECMSAHRLIKPE